jgi:FkbM family methyltransferase
MSAPEVPAGLTRTVVRGASVAGAGFALTITLSFFFYLVLARLATPEDFGVLAAGSLFVGVGMVFAESGMLAAIIQRRDRLEEAVNTAFVSTVLGGVALTLLALALSPLIGLVFSSHQIGVVAAELSGWLFLNLVAVVPNALLQRRFSFVRRVVVEPLSVLAFGITAIIACAQGLGVWGLVLGTYASGAAHAVLSWAFAGWRPNLRLATFTMWRELVGFGRHIFASEILARAGTIAETLFLGRFVSPASLGHYRYAYRIASLPLLAAVNVGSYVLFPAFARISNDQERFRAAVLRSLRWMWVLALPASLFLLALGEPLAVLLFGQRWRPTGYALMALSGYGFGGAVMSLASEAFKALGRPELLPRIVLLSAGLSVSLMVAGIPFGLVGVATAVSIASLAVGAYSLRLLVKVIDFPLQTLLSAIWAPTVASLTAGLSLLAFEQLVAHADQHALVPGFAILFAEAAGGIVLYLLVLAALAPPLARELVQLRFLDAAGVLRASSLPLRSRMRLLAIGIRHKLRPAPEYSLRVGSGSVFLSDDALTADRGAFEEVFVDECYAGDHRGAIVVDIGAHKGYYSAYAAKHGAAAILAYEPERRNLSYLRRTAESYQDSRWHVHDVAVGARAGDGTLWVNAEPWAHSLLQPLAAGDPPATQPVEIVPFGDVIRKARSLGDGKLLVKIDAEGAECEIVLESEADCWRRVDQVVIETHDFAPCSADDLALHLEGVGLVLTRSIDLKAGRIIRLSRLAPVEGNG